MISELVVLDTDRDLDGFDTSEDCDDFDPSVNPGEQEICADGIDNDCNGLVDENFHLPVEEHMLEETVPWSIISRYWGFPPSYRQRLQTGQPLFATHRTCSLK